MKSIKFITLGAILTLGVFFAVIYTSCSKDQCGDITCLNKGTCMGGICKCATGIFGANCESIYRKTYSGAYVGLPPDDPASDTTNILVFVPSEDTTNYNTMDVIWIDTSGASKVILPIELKNNSSAGSNFSISPVTYGYLTYTGTGSVNSTIANMQIREADTNGVVTHTWNFNNYIKN
jgi:hypothetical protein